MKSIVRILIPFLALGAMGCMPKHPQAPRETKANPYTVAAFNMVGTDAAVVLVLRPQQWQVVSSRLRPALSGLDERLDRALGKPDMGRALGELLGISSLSSEGLAGWDQARPVVAGLYAAQPQDIVKTLSLAHEVMTGDFNLFELLDKALSHPEYGERINRNQVTVVRHRLIIPASDPEKLEKALQRIFQAKKMTPYPVRKGEVIQIFGFSSREGFTAIRKGRDPSGESIMIVDIVVDDLTFRLGNEARSSAWLKLVKSFPENFPGPVTPALLYATSATDWLVAHVRPWQLANLAAQEKAYNLWRALGVTERCQQQKLMVSAVVDLLKIKLFLSPQGAEFDDLALGLNLEGSPRLNVVFSLTEKGRSIYRAGQEKTFAPPVAAEGGYSFTVWSRLDLQAMLQQASLLPQFTNRKNPSELAVDLRDCGELCLDHALLRAPIALVRTLLDLGGINLTGSFPRSLSYAAQETGRGGSKKIKLAAALQFPTTADESHFRASLAKLWHNLKLRLPEPQLSSELRKDSRLMLLGAGLDARKVFKESKQHGEDNVAAELMIDLSQGANSLDTFDPMLTAVLAKLGRVRARAFVEPRMVNIQIVADGSGEAPTYQPVVPPQDFNWKSLGPEASTRGADCMNDVINGLIAAFEAFDDEAAGQKSSVMKKAFEKMQEPLACAIAEPDTKELATRVRAKMALLVSDLLEAEWHLDSQLAVLDAACRQGHQEVCRRREQVRSLPRFQLPEVDTACQSRCREQGQIVRITATGASPDASVLAERLALRRPYFAIAGDARWDGIEKVVRQAARYQSELWIMLRQRGKGLVKIPIELSNDEVSSRTIPVVLKVRGARVEATVGGTLAYKMRVNCRAGKKRQALDELRDKIAAAIARLGDPRLATIHLQVAPATKFKNLAPVLAVASCLKNEDGYYDIPPSVLLSSLPRPAARGNTRKTKVVK